LGVSINRQLLALEVPQLRAGSLLRAAQTARVVGEAVAGRDPDELAVRMFAGAAMGAWMAALFHWGAHPDREDIVAALDRGHGPAGDRPDPVTAPAGDGAIDG
jgi:hypothetical protein